jgi:hypothetical protein
MQRIWSEPESIIIDPLGHRDVVFPAGRAIHPDPRCALDSFPLVLNPGAIPVSQAIH